MAYLAIPTLAGQAAIAAALDPENPVAIALAKVVVGDGNGNPVTPVETQTGLVNQTAEVPISATSRSDNKLTIDGILDETIGDFTIREIGILDEDDVLLFVASVPPTEKVTASQNVADVLTIGVIVIVSDTAQVTVSVDGLTYATHDYVNTAVANIRTNIGTPLRPYHLTVKSMAVAMPPATPSPGDSYLVAADATGAWAGHTGKLTQYVGSETWIFVSVPIGFVVGNEADKLLYQKTGAATWTPVIPAGSGWLKQTTDGFGTITRTLGDPFDINGLTTRELADNDEIAFHDVSAGLKGKNTLNALADKLAKNALQHAQSWWLGNM